MQTVEIGRIDTRYERCRIRDPAGETQLLTRLQHAGIQQPVLGVEQGDRFLLMDGFKRVRCARKLSLSLIPARSLASEAGQGILTLIRAAKDQSLKILEEAMFIQELIEGQQMSVAEIAHHAGRSKSWVSMRRRLLDEMTPRVQELLLRGKFSVYAYMYTVRPFMRMNGIRPADIERFVEIAAGKALSLRDIKLLAEAYFQGPSAGRELIESGNLSWCLQQLKRSLSANDTYTPAEERLLRDLYKISKLMARLSIRCYDDQLQSSAFLTEANLLSAGLLEQHSLFRKALEALHARSRTG